MTEPDEEDDVPEADDVTADVCDCCGSVTLSLFKEGKMFATITLHADDWFQMIEDTDDQHEEILRAEEPKPSAH